MAVSLQEIARALGGEIHGSYVLAPGPGHSRRDRSLSVKLSASVPDGWICHSYAGDDWRACREHVAHALGLPTDRWRSRDEPSHTETEERRKARRLAEERHQSEITRKQRFALAIWEAAQDPTGSLVEYYLNSRGLKLPREIAGPVLRWHPLCPWKSGAVPAMVGALRDVRSGQIVGVHRTHLSADGRRLSRKVFGSAGNAAIMLDPNEAVGTGLTVGEGIETCLAARQMGLGPVWALYSTSNLAALPVLSGIETLNVLAENDPNGASAKAVEAVAMRWHEAERHVDILTPKSGRDMNDALLGRIAA